MDKPITKRAAIRAYGSVKALAAALGISDPAIRQWKDGAIPKKQALRLRFVLMPSYPWDRKRKDLTHPTL